MKLFPKKTIDVLLSDPIVYGFMWTTLILGFGQSIFSQRWSLVFLIILTVVLMLVPTMLHRWYNITLPRGIVMMSLLFVYTSLFLGETYGFYDRFWWWDIFLHGASAFGFGLISLGIVRMMQSAAVVQASAGLMSLFAFGFTLAMGTVWEIFEFILDTLFHFDMQEGLIDTMGDLIVDALGAFIVCLFGYLHWKYEKNNIIGKVVERMFHRYLK